MHIHHVGMTRAHYTPGTASRIRMVVLHATAGRYPGDYTWLRNGGGRTRNTWVSIHYYIDRQGRISEMVPDRHIAWHAGRSTWHVDGQTIDYNVGCNPVSLGIELENRNTGHDPYPAAQYAAALWLTRRLIAQYAIPRSQLVRHLDIAPGRKTDPAGFPWERFTTAVYHPPTPQRYRVLHDATPIREAPDAQAPIAWSGGAVMGGGNVFEGIDQGNGWVWHTGGIGFVAEDQVTLADVPDHLTPASTILHAPRTTLAHCTRYLLSRPHGGYSDWSIAAEILPAYFAVCHQAGVDPLVAIAQLVLETGNLTSWWSQRPRRNPAGIGVTGVPGQGVRFPTWVNDAIPAHVGRLRAYASPDPHPLVDTALSYRPLPASYRGIAPTIAGLAGTWATDPQYAHKLCRVAHAIREAS